MFLYYNNYYYDFAHFKLEFGHLIVLLCKIALFFTNHLLKSVSCRFCCVDIFDKTQNNIQTSQDYPGEKVTE